MVVENKLRFNLRILRAYLYRSMLLRVYKVNYKVILLFLFCVDLLFGGYEFELIVMKAHASCSFYVIGIAKKRLG